MGTQELREDKGGLDDESELTPAEWAALVFEEYTISREAFDKESPEHQEAIKWLFPTFESGQRRCKLTSQEWDFRCIKDLREARRACLYEYYREVPLFYEWQSDTMKLVGKYHPDVVLLKAALHIKWTRAPSPLFVVNDDRFTLFPTPWNKLPASVREARFEPRLAAYPITFDPDDRQWLGWKNRAHAIVIDWDKPVSEIRRCLAKLADKLRPPDVPRVNAIGKRTGKPFEELKWLSAWRLKSAGLSYHQAQEFLKEHASGSDPHGVIPRYASSGAWQTHALDKASKLIADAVVKHSRPTPRTEFDFREVADS